MYNMKYTESGNVCPRKLVHAVNHLKVWSSSLITPLVVNHIMFTISHGKVLRDTNNVDHISMADVRRLWHSCYAITCERTSILIQKWPSKFTYKCIETTSCQNNSSWCCAACLGGLLHDIIYTLGRICSWLLEAVIIIYN